MKSQSKSELNFMKNVHGGKVQAVHRWHTGHQVLIFDSVAEFERAKKAVETPTNPEHEK